MSTKVATFDVTVSAREGDSETVPAQLVCCSKCFGDPEDPTFWLVYTVKGHIHLQCGQCDETYCQGGEC
jgi:hypothetical protein